MLAETFDEIIEDVKLKTQAEAQNDLLVKEIKGGIPLEKLSQYSDIPISDLKALKALYVDGK